MFAASIRRSSHKRHSEDMVFDEVADVEMPTIDVLDPLMVLRIVGKLLGSSVVC
eukprot:CAMPEP_0195601112 /NCGR_PEP_ID=MMETSP0815-20121206/4910_1 /TAXON_ID=97485 /ORGANISM="Prymnesium parvum, Strain Texoma1" /LENGTH=53 /DNA_ID=CAMNT_0040740629 /DNA_START=1095 /DNA_END=1256 /DNA_ORIENTATION=+